jgi:hypothetical protein
MPPAAANPKAGAAPTAWELFQQLLPPACLNDLDAKAAQAAYTAWVVTWLLVFQRLHHNATLNDAVSEFLFRFPPQALPDCQRAQQHRLSANTGAYSLARTRLDRRVLSWATAHLYDSLIDAYPPSWGNRRAFLIDGTTIPLAPTPALQAAYPPARNQHGGSPWPILQLVVAHELQSGLAVMPACGPMYGPQAVSELSLAQALLPRLPPRSLLVADRNFGVFAFAYAAVAAQHDVLVRLTGPRFQALRQQARPLARGRWLVRWRPSAWDRRNHPEVPAGAELSGWLHAVVVSEQVTLWLFTTLDTTSAALAALYHQRLSIETDIRDVKETLALGDLRGKSVAMVEKELLAALLAYNLANQVRRLAAAQCRRAPRRLSFAGVWSLLGAFAQGLRPDHSAPEAEAAFARLLTAAGQRQLPRRPRGRSYPREVIPRHRKFPFRKRLQNHDPRLELKCHWAGRRSHQPHAGSTDPSTERGQATRNGFSSIIVAKGPSGRGECPGWSGRSGQEGRQSSRYSGRTATPLNQERLRRSRYLRP